MAVLGGGGGLMSEVPLYGPTVAARAAHGTAPFCEDRVLDGPASGEKGSKGVTLSLVRSSHESHLTTHALVFCY